MVHVLQGLFLYRPIFRQYIRRFLLESIDDGITYVEPRINFFHKYDIPLFHSRMLNDGVEVYVRC
jgi:hypothetical protein